MNDSNALLIGLASFFLLAFGGLTAASFAEANHNITSVFTYGVAAFIWVVVLIYVVNLIRHPPNE